MEATAVRRGNRKVKLIISGQVGQSLMVFDDGSETNGYVGSGPSSPRFRFEGSANITKDLTAGFYLELGVNQNPLNALDQETDSVGRRPDINSVLWYLQHARFGALSVGFGQTATGDTLYTNLGGQDVASSPDVMAFGGNLVTRSAGIAGEAGLNFSNGADNISLRWRRLAPDVGSADRNMVRYDSPVMAGVVVSAAAGSDDFVDANLRFANVRTDFNVAAQVGYSRDTSEEGRNFGWPPENDGDGGGVGGGNTIIQELQASGSVWHRPTGLFASAAYQLRWFDGNDPGMLNAACTSPVVGATCANRPDFHYLWSSAGIRRNFIGAGSTTIFGEYASAWGGVEGLAVGVVTAQGGDIDFVTNSRVDVFGGGIVQRIDAAALDIYVSARHFQADVSGLETTGARVKADIDAATVVITGARIRF